jgi:hypothetical protein
LLDEKKNEQPQPVQQQPIEADVNRELDELLQQLE